MVPRLPWWLSRKESTSNAADASSVPAAERSPREGNGNPLQCSCLGNLMVRGAWRATVHRVVKGGTRLFDWTTTNSMVRSIHWVPSINPWNKAYAYCQDLNKKYQPKWCSCSRPGWQLRLAASSPNIEGDNLGFICAQLNRGRKEQKLNNHRKLLKYLQHRALL